MYVAPSSPVKKDMLLSPSATLSTSGAASTPITATKRLSLVLQSVVGGVVGSGGGLDDDAESRSKTEDTEPELDITPPSKIDSNGGGVFMIGESLYIV